MILLKTKNTTGRSDKYQRSSGNNKLEKNEDNLAPHKINQLYKHPIKKKQLYKHPINKKLAHHRDP